MANTAPVFRGYGQNVTTGATMSCTFSTTPQTPGVNLVMFITFDNLTATTPTVSSITKPAGEPATWAKLYEINSPQAASGGGVRTEVWGITTTISWIGTTSVTVTFSSASTLKKLWHAFSTTGGDLAAATFQQAALGAAISKTTTIGNVYAHFGSGENNANGALAPLIGDVSWFPASYYADFTSGGGAAANIAWSGNWGLASTSVSPSWTYTGGTDGGHLVMEIPPLVLPKDILDIGTSGTNHFKGAFSTNSSVITSKTQAEIAAGYNINPNFMVVSFDRVQFSARADSLKSGSDVGAKSVLVETNADGSDMAFDATIGEHILAGQSNIVLWANFDKEVVIASLCNNLGDVISIGSRMKSDTTVTLCVYVNGTPLAQVLATGFNLGTEFLWKIRVISNTVEIYYVDMVTPSITIPAALTATTPAASWFFNVGAQNLFNNTTAGAGGNFPSGTDSSIVTLRNLSVFHNFSPIGGGTDTQKIAIGSSLVGIDKLYIGTTKINRVYVGTTMVYDDV